MADAPLTQLALAAGLLPVWEDVYHQQHQVSEDTLRYMLNALGLPCATDQQTASSLQRLAAQSGVQPLQVSGDVPQCLTLNELTGPMVVRPWGLMAQVYSLRTHDGAAPGEYGAVAALAGVAARLGASALGLSPIHAMFSADPARYSPYSPSSRLFLNTAYIDPAQVVGKPKVAAAMAACGIDEAQLNPVGTVDWPEILPQRLRVLKQLFSGFQQQASAAQADDFRAFRQQGGIALRDHACYEALHAILAPTLGTACGWQDWPVQYHDPRGVAVQAWEASHQDEVLFYSFLQWLADKNMCHAQQVARDAGMEIGLITDLAIGTDPRGSHAWSRQGQMLAGVAVGAPPDAFQPLGQNWGLTAFSPLALGQDGYQAFAETLHAALRYAGGVRIDHILGMSRLWLVPDGATAAQGVYLRYPLADMLGVIAQVAREHQALVIGENLGTVPEGFNARLEQAGILGTSVLWFERSPAALPSSGSVSASDFTPSAQWSPQTVAMPSTHDLPTITGWWQGRDLYWREQQGLLAGMAAQEETATRGLDKVLLRQTMAREDSSLEKQGDSDQSMVPLDAVLAFVARTPVPLALFSMEDVLGVLEQPNLPGPLPTGGIHPNWRQRLPLTVQELGASARLKASVKAIVQARHQV
ncbi:MAG: 4-alpha-glucanotransferase [Burkholderiaceae bacterium]|nr:4-alpha-glucanotransferase [Burkholderiaceae bacterium]